MPIAVRTDFQSGYSGLGNKIGGTVSNLGARVNQGFNEAEKLKDKRFTRSELQRKFDQSVEDKNSFNEVKSIMVNEIKENFPNMKAKRLERTLDKINSIRFDGGKGIGKLHKGISNLSKLNSMSKKAKEEGTILRDWDATEIFMDDSAKRLFSDYEKSTKDASVGKAVMETKKLLDEKKPESMEDAYSMLPPEYEKYDEVTNFVKKRYMKQKDIKSLEIRQQNANRKRVSGGDKEFDNVSAARSGLGEIDKKLKDAKENYDEHELKVLDHARKMMLQDKTLNSYEAYEAAGMEIPPEPEEPEDDSKWYNPMTWGGKDKPKEEPLPYEQGAAQKTSKLTDERRKGLQALVR